MNFCLCLKCLSVDYIELDGGLLCANGCGRPVAFDFGEYTHAVENAVRRGAIPQILYPTLAAAGVGRMLDSQLDPCQLDHKSPVLDNRFETIMRRFMEDCEALHT